MARNGKPAPDARHPDDTGKEDVVALDPSEEVVHLPPVPDLRRPVRRALPQPRPRGPQHDVRLGDPPVSIGRHDRSRSGRPAGPERGRARAAALLSRREAKLRSAATACLVGHRAGAGDRAALPAPAGTAAGRPFDRGDGGVRRAGPDARRGAGEAARQLWRAVAAAARARARRLGGAAGVRGPGPGRLPGQLDGDARRALRRVRGRRLGSRRGRPAAHAGRDPRPAHRGGRDARPGARRRRARSSRPARAPSGGETVARRRRPHPRARLARERASGSRRGPAATAATTSTAVARRAQTALEVALIVAAALVFVSGAVGLPAPAQRRPRSERDRDRRPGLQHEPRAPHAACALLALGLLARERRPGARPRHAARARRPAAGGRGVSEGRSSVMLRFSEPVQILNRSDVSVVNSATAGSTRARRTRSRAIRACSSSRCAARCCPTATRSATASSRPTRTPSPRRSCSGSAGRS